MVCIVVGVLVALLSYVFVQATHHTTPNAQPQAPLHDAK